MSTTSTGWCAVYTRPRHEKKVTALLEEMQVDFFLPTTRKLRNWSDRRKYVEMPLFPSYVFVRVNNGKNYFNVMSIEGVLYFVRQGKEIARISDAVIDNIRFMVQQQGEIEVSDQYFKPGQQAYIRQGLLTGLLCEVVQVNGRQKMLVRVNLLQRNLLMTLSADKLLPASVVS